MILTCMQVKDGTRYERLGEHMRTILGDYDYESGRVTRQHRSQASSMGTERVSLPGPHPLHPCLGGV